MKAALAQGFALGFLSQGWFLEFNDLAHAPQMFPEETRRSFRLAKFGTTSL